MCGKKPVKFLPVKPKKTKNTANYYQCLLNASLNNGFKGRKISSVCRNCKNNPTDLLADRNQQIQLLMTAYEQLGSSLKSLLTPLNYD